ncbi:hypothetical protein P7C70_g2830, partial [Phenoliferia sp. Uapishka_3]
MSRFPTPDQMREFLKTQPIGTGRSLDELLECKDPQKDRLRGDEAQRLRVAFSDYALDPDECSDSELVSSLMNADLERIERRWSAEVQKLGGGEEGKRLAAKKWEDWKDSPNKLPIYDILQAIP